MRLRTLAGAYAGQVRDYSTEVGCKALRSGTAERVIEAGPLTPPARTVLAIGSIHAAAQMTQAAAIDVGPEKPRKRKK